jgi:peptide/nickel transport system permease protein
MALVSLFWTPYSPTAMDARDRMEAPSPNHPLGTDQYGRDLLSSVMVGAVNSIVVA